MFETSCFSQKNLIQLITDQSQSIVSNKKGKNLSNSCKLPPSADQVLNRHLGSALPNHIPHPKNTIWFFSVVKLASDIEKKHGGINILVNNASIAFEFNEEPSKEPFAYQAKETIHTNYFGTRMVCKHLFPLLRSGARVVNMSSDSGFLAMIPGETLRNKLKRTDLSIDELDNIMNDFVDAAQAGKHEANGLFLCYK